MPLGALLLSDLRSGAGSGGDVAPPVVDEAVFSVMTYRNFLN